jgi:hypothetical protein
MKRGEGMGPVEAFLEVKLRGLEARGYCRLRATRLRFSNWASWIRTNACRSQSAMPYRLAIAQGLLVQRLVWEV